MGKELEKTFRDMNWIIGRLVLGKEEKVVYRTVLVWEPITMGEEEVLFSSMEMVLNERAPLLVRDTGVVVLSVVLVGKMDFPE